MEGREDCEVYYGFELGFERGCGGGGGRDGRFEFVVTAAAAADATAE